MSPSDSPTPSQLQLVHPPATRETLLGAEDKRFYSHGGVDFLALANAMRDRLSGGRGRGASTLSMQVAGFLSTELAAPGARGWQSRR